MWKAYWVLVVGMVAFYAIVIGLMIHGDRKAEERHQDGIEAILDMYFDRDVAE